MLLCSYSNIANNNYNTISIITILYLYQIYEATSKSLIFSQFVNIQECEKKRMYFLTQTPCFQQNSLLTPSLRGLVMEGGGGTEMSISFFQLIWSLTVTQNLYFFFVRSASILQKEQTKTLITRDRRVWRYIHVALQRGIVLRSFIYKKKISG